MSRACPVAIVGMSVLLPGARNLDAYWKNLVDGVDAITEVPPHRWDEEFYSPDERGRSDRVYCRRGGFIDDLADVEVAEFGIMPNSVPSTEPDQLIALRVAAQAISDAGGTQQLPEDRQRAGVVFGRGGYLTPGLARLDQRVRTASQLVRTLGELMPELEPDRLEQVREAFTDQLGPQAPESAIGLVPNLAVSRLANRLDLRGPAYTVDAACASSLIAVDHAVRELESHRCDTVLAGGVHHCHDITFWSVFSQLGALSSSERIRPFHRDADGVLIGEGTGVVVLKRLEDAERDGDRVYAVITGTGVASDGKTASLLNPDSGGQVRAVRQAWEEAELDPRQDGVLGLLEAHGTATPAGDGAELSTIAEVFGGPNGSDRSVVGSVKSMIGHTMPAAGVAGLVKAALSVYHGVLPPTLHCDEPNPALENTRFTTVDTARSWETRADQPVRRAAVNAFGFGGINAHVVLEQGKSRPVEVVEPERVLRLAARNPAALGELLDTDDSTVLRSGLDERVDVAEPTRLGIVEPTARRLALARKAVAKGKSWRGRNDVWFTPEPLLGAGSGKLAFVFPGLEAEFEPNSGDIAQRFGLRWSLAEADTTVGDIGRQGTGVFELGRLLNDALHTMNIVPDALAGHSLGEWTAMAAGGIHSEAEVDAFLADFDPDALTVPGLAFAVVGSSADHVADELDAYPDVVLSHDNAPNQAMMCGPEEPIEELIQRFRDRAVIAQRLPFQSGFHTPMLKDYLGPIVEAAETYTLYPQRLPVWSATTMSPYPAAEKDVRDLFVRHLLEPVRFRPMIESMYEAGFRAFVQLGAGQLGSLISDTLSDSEHLVVPAHSTHRSGIAQLHRVATALWVDGGQPDLTKLLGTVEPVSRSHAPVRLDLGGALVSLDTRTRRDFPGTERGTQASVHADTSTLDKAAADFPLADEFSAMLTDTAAMTAEVIAAYRATPGSPERPRPAAPVRETRTSLSVSLEEMPYLVDHCFFKQPSGADPEDGWPVVPATTLVEHIMRFAEDAAPGRQAVAVHGARFNKWINAIPASSVPVEVVAQDNDRVAVGLGTHANAVIELAAQHPSPKPSVWSFPASAESTPELSAEELYSQRWMFHGPQFQGVTELTAIGDKHVRAELTAPAAPGALLDNVGQVLGFWIMARLTSRTTVFPVGIGEVRFYGPRPAAGQRLECLVRITSVTEHALEADMQLVHNGQVWAEFVNWRDRRFDSNPVIRRMDRVPERNTLSTQQPGDWELVTEQWPDLATRELIMRNMLAGQERSDYEVHPPRGKRQWLLGRIAAKDAVRRRLWEAGVGGVFPSELRVSNQPSGQPVVHGAYGRSDPPLMVSIAHCGEVGVAIARQHACGIDVEEVTERPESTVTAAVGHRELSLLEKKSTESGESRALWFARFWTAKEAVAKRRGTGLKGAPKQFEVVRSSADASSELVETDVVLIVRVDDVDHRVRCRSLSNPAELSARDYVVAWTDEEDQEKEDDR